MQRHEAMADDLIVDYRREAEILKRTALNRPGFTGECLVQLLGRFSCDIQGLVVVLLSFLRRDIADFRV